MLRSSLFLLIISLFTCCNKPLSKSETATQTNFNQGWEFVKGIDASLSAEQLSTDGYPSISWQSIALPHTAQLEPLVISGDQWQGTSFYRKSFQVPASDKGRHLALKFEAAMQVAEVYLNGKPVFRHLGGYLPFYVDISDELKYGQENVVLVKLNNEDLASVPPGKPVKDLDFNYFSGIYRNVYLISKDKLHISDPIAAARVAGGGILINYENVSKESARLMVQTEIKNEHPEAKGAQVRVLLTDQEGNQIAEEVSELQDLGSGAFGTFSQYIDISNPSLWSPDHPYLYTLRVELLQNGEVIDQQSLKTGVRSFRFTADAFYLNGEQLFIRGTNRHQEYPYIGYALSDNARYRDAWKIKEAGFNFVRLSHYPQSAAFIEACDELGLLVMDAIPGWQYFGDEDFQENSLQDVRDMVRRDRNHPSIILWEASLNESGMTKEFMEKAHEAVHEELPFADVYTCGWMDYAYDVFIPARQHAKAPDYWGNYKKDKPLFIAEYGDWEYYAQNAGFNQKEFADLQEEERTSRQLRGDGEKRLLQQALNYQEAHNSNLQGPAVGDANWLMFDYNRGYAPDLEASGISDIFRTPKFAFYFYQSQYGPFQEEAEQDKNGFGKPMAYIANFWSPSSVKEVVVYSNCDEIELFLNGESIGRQKSDQNRYSTHIKHPPFSFSMPEFKPGKLWAVGYLNGEKVVEAHRETPGSARKIALSYDRSGKELEAGVKDVVFLYASVVDENGTRIPDAEQAIRFKIEEGDAELIGRNPMEAQAGIATVLLRAGTKVSTIKVSALSEGLEGADLSISVASEKEPEL
jgi:beta-galactosidase